MKGNRRRIVIKDKDRTYIFRVNMLLKPSDMELIRNQLKQQIKEGCVVLPAGVELVDVEARLLAKEYNVPEMTTDWKQNIMGKFEKVE